MNTPHADTVTSAAAHPASRFVPAALAFCGMALAMVTSRGPPVGVLDAILFSYYNNTAGPDAVMYFNGWVHLVPEAIAYFVRALPAVAQFAIYICVAACCAFVMLREVSRLLTLWFSGIEAALLALVVPVYFQFYLPVLHQLAWCIWPLVVAACCHILRRNFSGEAFSWPGLTATTVACLSNPTAVVFIPLLGVFAVTAQDKTLRRQNIALAVLLLLYFSAMAAFKPDGAHYLPDNVALDAARAVWHQLKAPLWRTVPIVLTVAALGALWGAALLRKIEGDTRNAILALGYVGFASLALFLLSRRATITSSLPPRYTVTCSIAALLALAAYAAGRLDARERHLMLTIIAAGIGLAEIYLLATRLPAQLRRSREQLAFARAIDDFRSTCQPGEAFTRNAKPPGFAVLCRHIDRAATAALPVVRTDPFGNVFVSGPQARLWPTRGAAPIELLAPRR